MKKIIIALSCLLLVSACGCSEKSDSKASSSEPATEEVTTVKEETKHSDTNASQKVTKTLNYDSDYVSFDYPDFFEISKVDDKNGDIYFSCGEETVMFSAYDYDNSLTLSAGLQEFANHLTETGKESVFVKEYNGKDWILYRDNDTYTFLYMSENYTVCFLTKIKPTEKKILTFIKSCEFKNDVRAELESKPSTEALTEAQTEENKASNLTLSQQNALKSAKSYIEFSNFSKNGLIGQLEYEKYPHEDAVLAVESISVDWNEQAVGSAKSYISTSGFSYEGLIGQLEYEEYTHEQAVYGADNCGADWNEMAKKTAEDYLSFSSFSRDDLKDQLLYEKYTEEQAEYALSAVGY